MHVTGRTSDQKMDRSLRNNWSPNNRSNSTCAAIDERAPLLHHQTTVTPLRSASISVSPSAAYSTPETPSRPVEIRRKESLKPADSLKRRDSRRESIKSPPNAQEINGGLLRNGPIGIPVENGLLTYRDVVSSPLPEEDEDEDTQLAVTCRVCNAEIIIEKEEGFVVKCPACNEATPIRNAPVGEKYVRCPCHCLLICKDSSERIACPRQNCKRIITITAAADGQTQSFATPHDSTPGTCRVICAHCGQEFLFNVLHKSLAKCPHCNKISAVGNVYRRRQLKVYSIVAFLFTLITVLVIVSTGFLVVESGGIVALYIGLVAISVLAFIRVIYFLRMRVSVVQGAV